ncbi:PfkB family carbohydrate kinase [Mucilaginibacter sp. BT774]|uniref:PfkB family carbohydrate kinase n=1 Tax=Mucilaginibacter sp. BT774 TaxID=3062276 RepID=UPI002675FDD6|nr:PfkB family carbohydrate kinase [Mucilaginibacter sp. BT774]MDO3627718.1 PfkB family carbohydrate kinase [Mucilaginibacter sp. BT774]
MYDICCVGHLTSDKIVTPKTTIYMAGGTAFYFSYAVCNLDVKYLLMTALAEDEMQYVDRLRGKGLEIKVQPSTHTVFFENIYGDNPDIRTQNVLAKADPFAIEPLQDIEAQIFHLGPLLADDMSTEFIKEISKKGKVSLDAQGYLRKVENQKVLAVDWSDKTEALQYVDILKVDEAEMTVLTGYKAVSDGAKLLADWGVKEVVITNGSMGSTIYFEDTFYSIPAYRPQVIVDATGCGDTYMGGYLYQRVKGKDIQESGEFAAAIASLKMESPGPFKGTEQDVIHRLSKPF